MKSLIGCFKEDSGPSKGSILSEPFRRVEQGVNYGFPWRVARDRQREKANIMESNDGLPQAINQNCGRVLSGRQKGKNVVSADYFPGPADGQSLSGGKGMVSAIGQSAGLYRIRAPHRRGQQKADPCKKISYKRPPRDLFANIHDLAPVGFLTIDSEGVIQGADRMAMRLLCAKNKRSLLSRPLISLLATPSHRKRKPVFANIKKNGEWVMRRMDGSTFFAGVKISNIPGSSPRTGQWLISFSDITKRRETEQALKASENELALIYEHAPFVMLVVDACYRVHRINKFGKSFLRKNSARLPGRLDSQMSGCIKGLGCCAGDGFGPGCQECPVHKLVSSTLKTGRAYHKTRVNLHSCPRGGKHLNVLLSCSRIAVGDRPYALLTFEDITSRVRTEERIAQLDRAKAILAGVDHAIVHTPERAKLLNSICQTAVEKGGFKLAWIGFVAADGEVKPVAAAGETGYLKGFYATTKLTPKGRGPVGLAAREGRTIIINDIDSDPSMNPWRERAQQFGLHYVCAVPIRMKGNVVGVMAYYAPRVGFFDEEEVALLNLVTEELAFALCALDAAERHKIAEEALRRNEAEMADFFEQSPLGLLWVELNGRVQRVNQAELELLGRDEKEVLGQEVGLFHAEPEAIENLLGQLAAGTTVRDFRTRIRRKDGQTRHVLIDANGKWVKKRLKHTQWFVRDITQRVELEQEILTIGERIQRQLGQDLHDDLCQQLTSIEFLSQALADELRSQTNRSAIQATEIARLLRQSIAKVRMMSHGLLPVGMKADGLRNALQWLADSIREIYGIQCRFRFGRAPSLSPTASIHLYRIVQEAVNNAIKHGKARRIDISLSARNGSLAIAVKNDGRPFPNDALEGKGIGLRLMRFRAGLIGGMVKIQKESSGRTAVICTVPIEKKDTHL